MWVIPRRFLGEYGCFMGKHPERRGFPFGANQALARLLSRENAVSDFIALLAGLDSAPLLTALDLRPREVRIKREDLLGGKSGRADLVVRDENGTPLALLEIKLGADEHGDQFDRYDSWAKVQAKSPKCYLIALDGEALNAPEGWYVEFALPQLFRCWTRSRDPQAAWLGTAVAGVIEDWIAQANGKLGEAAGPIVGDLIARKIATDLPAQVSPRTDLVTYATRTNGGAAMVLAYVPFPGKPQETGPWLCADLRSKFREHPEASGS